MAGPAGVPGSRGSQLEQRRTGCRLLRLVTRWTPTADTDAGLPSWPTKIPPGCHAHAHAVWKLKDARALMLFILHWVGNSWGNGGNIMGGS
jgi:urease accessory protein UreF